MFLLAGVVEDGEIFVTKSLTEGVDKVRLRENNVVPRFLKDLDLMLDSVRRGDVIATEKRDVFAFGGSHSGINGSARAIIRLRYQNYLVTKFSLHPSRAVIRRPVVNNYDLDILIALPDGTFHCINDKLCLIEYGNDDRNELFLHYFRAITAGS
ncbi:hypothetical protein BOSP111201_01335 [Bordetella sputigena]